MDGAAAWILVLSAVTVLASCHKVCFIGTEYNPQSGIPNRWSLPYKDPCECTAIRLGGMHIPGSLHRQVAPHYLDELFTSEDFNETQAYFNCSRETTECSSPGPLGMENGTIPHDYIRASSAEPCCPAWEGRLNYDGTWKPSSSENSWIEVDLINSTVVSGVITNSRSHKSYKGYVKKYKVAYQKQPTFQYEHVIDEDGNVKVFMGNTGYDTPVTNMFDESVVATVVRIEPTEWHERIRLQFELLGCRRK